MNLAVQTAKECVAQKAAPKVVQGVSASRYLLLEEIGEGGFAKVFRAKNDNGGIVAIKLLREEFARCRLQEAFFYNESQALKCIDHPGVVRLVDCGRDAELPFIAMEHVNGKPLHLSQRELVRRNMLRIATLACEALSAVHRRGIVHGDLLPGNIMLVAGPGGLSIRIIDFGASSVPNVTPCPGWDCMRVGGANYGSPESHRGREYMDGRSDLYSLGAVMYDMLARRPYFGMLGMNEARDPARFLAPMECIEGESPEVNAVLAKALAKEPANRFQDAKEMRESLESCLAMAA